MIDYTNNNPCRDCTKRHVGCHGTCKEYLDWSAKLKEQNAKIRKKRDYIASGFPEILKRRTKK